MRRGKIAPPVGSTRDCRNSEESEMQRKCGLDSNLSRILRCLTIVGGIYSGLSCASDRIRNDWLNVRPREVAAGPWQVVPADRVREVPPDLTEEVLRLLATESVRWLSPEDTRRFASGDTPREEYPAFLMRAVRTPSQNGRYEVLRRDDAVAVVYHALSQSVATEKSAVMVHLSDMPRSVYVE